MHGRQVGASSGDASHLPLEFVKAGLHNWTELSSDQQGLRIRECLKIRDDRCQTDCHVSSQFSHRIRVGLGQHRQLIDVGGETELRCPRCDRAGCQYSRCRNKLLAFARLGDDVLPQTSFTVTSTHLNTLIDDAHGDAHPHRDDVE